MSYKNESFLIFCDQWIKKLFESCLSLRSGTQEDAGSNYIRHRKRRKGHMAFDGQNQCPLHHNPRQIQRIQGKLCTVCVQCPQQPEEGTGSHGTGAMHGWLQVTMWSEPGSSAGSASSLNHWLLSPAPSYAFLVEDSMRVSLYQERPVLHISLNGFAKANSTLIFPVFPL